MRPIDPAIASYAAKDLKAIPWNTLAKAAPGGDPFFAPDYFYQYMGPAFEAANAVMDTLEFSDIKWNDASALEAFKRMRAAGEKVEGGVLESITNSVSQSYAVMQFDALTLKLYILDLFLTAQNGLLLHAHWVPQEWVKQAAQYWEQATDAAEKERRYQEMLQRQDDGMAHAALVTAMFEAVVKLDKYHVLNPIKKGSAQSGLGIAPVVIGVVIAIAAVVAIALLIWSTATLVDVTQKNKILREICVSTKDETVLKKCVDAAKQSSFQPNFGDVAGSVTKWLVAGGLVAAAVYFAPLIVTKFNQAKKAAHAT